MLQRNWALISIVVTLVILVVVPILILRKYVHLIANIFQNTHVPLSFTARDYPRVGGEVVDFRATTTGDSFQLDLGAPLRVIDATLDGYRPLADGLTGTLSSRGYTA